MVNQMYKNISWNEVCIIGLGGHAKNKIIPALNAANLKISGLVSRDPVKNIDGSKKFSNINDAIIGLPETTLFIISSPPEFHFSQAKKLLMANRDVFIEKPAFLSYKDFFELSEIAKKKNIVLAEMMMYTENKCVKHIFDLIKRRDQDITNIEFNFLIPSVPSGTFRDESSFGKSLLADMACYPLSFLVLSGFDLSNLSLLKTSKKNNKNFSFHIGGTSNETNILINIGCDEVYKNSIAILFNNNDFINCEPFFYGRDGLRKLNKTLNNITQEHEIYEDNSFEILFNRRRSEWIYSQKKRMIALGNATKILENIGMQASF